MENQIYIEKKNSQMNKDEARITVPAAMRLPTHAPVAPFTPLSDVPFELPPEPEVGLVPLLALTWTNEADMAKTRMCWISKYALA
jgi:hypothetical protein